MNRRLVEGCNLDRKPDMRARVLPRLAYERALFETDGEETAWRRPRKALVDDRKSLLVRVSGVLVSGCARPYLPHDLHPGGDEIVRGGATSSVPSSRYVHGMDDDVDGAVETLRAAAMALRYDGSKPPHNNELWSAWPDLGRAWVAAWVVELGRDASTIAADLRTARAAKTDDDALAPLENAAWRLGGAREDRKSVV